MQVYSTVYFNVFKFIKLIFFDCHLSVHVFLYLIESEVHGNEDNNEDSDEQSWDTPLSVTFFQNDSGLQSLRRFVSAVLNQFGEDLDMQLSRNKDILQQALRKYKNPSFDITRPLNVSFVDEPGLDGGGVTREYFHLLMQRLQKPMGSFDLFEGQSGHLVPTHNYDFLTGGLFVLVGKMILHSVINSCNGMPGLSPAVIAYLVSGSRDASIEYITLDDLPDPVFQEKLNQVFHLYSSIHTGQSSSIMNRNNISWSFAHTLPHCTVLYNR